MPDGTNDHREAPVSELPEIFLAAMAFLAIF
jgi:hypothetical protein